MSPGSQLLAIDYRGFGDSTGTPTEAGVLVDAMTAWEYVTETLKGGILMCGVESNGFILSVNSATQSGYPRRSISWDSHCHLACSPTGDRPR